MMNIANEHKFTFIPVGGLSNIFFDFPPQPECNVRIKSRIWGCICAFAQFAPLAPIAWLVPSPASPFYFPDFQRLHFQRSDFQRPDFKRPLHKEPTCSHQILPGRLLNIAKNLSMHPARKIVQKYLLQFGIIKNEMNFKIYRLQVPNNYCI